MKPTDRWLWTSILFFAVTTSGISYPDNTPPKGVDVWCGKAYRATDSTCTLGMIMVTMGGR